jgi:hypothetical protein
MADESDRPDHTVASKKRKAHHKYNSQDADVTIVSSDGVSFKVHSYQLQTASSVYDFVEKRKTV